MSPLVWDVVTLNGEPYLHIEASSESIYYRIKVIDGWFVWCPGMDTPGLRPASNRPGDVIRITHPEARP